MGFERDALSMGRQLHFDLSPLLDMVLCNILNIQYIDGKLSS